ncbi:hypothetical protein [Rhizobacter sp. SG703]|uniref:hypothetical protein n=1 Tax=Rhizobacter sp. SG703 TaxID=2587140 RepID=UPI001446886E|nr:hypothetical protein [Rhizobacter sp. SG703]
MIAAAASPSLAVHPWDATSYRGCELCIHSQRSPDGLACVCPSAVAPLPWQSVVITRDRQGTCGPDARHLHFPSFDA